MKSLAGQFVWWPNMDSEIERYVKNCTSCQVSTRDPPLTSLHLWEWPRSPWTQVHADFAGPFLGKMYLVTIDAYSKWMEVQITSGATSAITINKVKITFSSLGLPQILVTDNEPAFSSQEFTTFVKANGMKHVTSISYHPASNGLAEKAIQTIKATMKKLTKGSLEERVMQFLFKYRITPQSTTGQSPSDLLFGHRLRSHLDLLHPNLSAKARAKQNAQKHTHDYHSQDCDFELDDLVFAKNYRRGSPWLPGVIVAKRSATSFLVQLPAGSIIRRHPDQLKHRSADVSEAPSDNSDDILTWPDISPANDSSTSSADNERTVVRHSNRTRRPPDRFLPYNYSPRGEECHI